MISLKEDIETQKVQRALATLIIELLLQSQSEKLMQSNHGGGVFKLYKNEILIADNTILLRLGNKRAVFISHNITELLLTSHEGFCNHTEQFIVNLQNRSVLISTTGEKERNKFFNRMEEKIETVRKKLS